ncbi:hypothetical protein EYF80_037126 [Liparis tanakae]|uniref:Uncharacterized protein n=1 Tax=Liparis tanakae TaxID=230148 RepID=A0A4Z2GHN9_9TELE|nr:hypothetical protein EYF80_037126 [Liparis tanakae]
MLDLQCSMRADAMFLRKQPCFGTMKRASLRSLTGVAVFTVLDRRLGAQRDAVASVSFAPSLPACLGSHALADLRAQGCPLHMPKQTQFNGSVGRTPAVT